MDLFLLMKGFISIIISTKRRLLKCGLIWMRPCPDMGLIQSSPQQPVLRCPHPVGINFKQNYFIVLYNFFLPRCISPTNPQMWHHMCGLLYMVHRHFEVPFPVHGRTFHSTHEDVWSNTKIIKKSVKNIP